MDRFTLNRRRRRGRVRNGGAARRRDGARGPRGRRRRLGGASRRLLVLRQEPGAQPRRRVRQGPDRDGHERRRAALDEHRGQFGAAAYTGFGVGWFSASSKGPVDKGKNYFFGGTTTAATSAKASIGSQTIKLPASAAGHKATLSGWLGNYARIPPAFARRSPTRRGRRLPRSGSGRIRRSEAETWAFARARAPFRREP